MYNPQFKETQLTVRYLVDKHHEDIEDFKLTWKELKDEDGDVYQIVPIFDITFKK